MLESQQCQQHKHQRADAAVDHQGEERRSWCRLQWQAKREPALLPTTPLFPTTHKAKLNAVS